MDIQNYIYFSVLAETLNYTTAADKCHVSRQGLRQSVARLEEEYGLELVRNEHNRLRLTEAGLLLRDRIAVLLADYAKLEKDLQACRHGRIRLGVSRSLLPFYAPGLPTILRSFTEHYPGIELIQSILPTDDVLQELQDDTLDAGLVIDDGSQVPGFHRTPLRSDPLRILISSLHPLASRPLLALQDLEGLTLHLMSDPGVCFQQLSHALQTAGVHVHFVVEPDYYRVLQHLEDHSTAALDIGDEPMDTLSRTRLVPLSGAPEHLTISFLTRQHSGPVHLLENALCRRPL